MPRQSHARTVNAYDPLLRRLLSCQEIRDHLPNLVAVNLLPPRRRLPGRGHPNGVGGR